MYTSSSRHDIILLSFIDPPFNHRGVESAFLLQVRKIIRNQHPPLNRRRRQKLYKTQQKSPSAPRYVTTRPADLSRPRRRVLRLPQPEVAAQARAVCRSHSSHTWRPEGLSRSVSCQHRAETSWKNGQSVGSVTRLETEAVMEYPANWKNGNGGYLAPW